MNLSPGDFIIKDFKRSIMKIAHITTQFPKISETFIMNQVIGLQEAGHEIDIFSHAPADENITHSIVEEHDLIEKTTYTEPPATYLGAVKRVCTSLINKPKRAREIIQSLQYGSDARNRICFLDTLESEYDLYHAHFGWVAENTDFIPSVFDSPFIISFYGNDAGSLLKKNPRRYESVWSEADIITVLSYDMKEQIINAGAPEKKVVLNPLPINIDNFKFSFTKYNRPLKIVTVARLTEKKGLKYALRAISQINNEIDIKYKIAGDGEQRNKLESIIKKENLSNSVELCGWLSQEEIDELLEEAHIFLLPSHTASDGDREGTPTALLEAQAKGLPIISTYHAGIPEIVKDKQHGYLCPVIDPDSISKSIMKLVEQNNNWKTMAEDGRDFIKSTHSKKAQTQRLEQIYQDVIN